jgi:TRAP-type C4-dicarboxylate transport system substrate-binding protein
VASPNYLRDNRAAALDARSRGSVHDRLATSEDGVMARAAVTSVLIALCVSGMVVSGCEATRADKAGGSNGVITLRLATGDRQGLPAGDQIEKFASQVATLSNKRIRIQPVWEANGRPIRDWDQSIARKVIGSTYEMGLVPARAFDVLGVKTLQPLQVPFLVQTASALNSITTDPIADRLLAGLDKLHLVGLALFPDSFRHPVGFAAPIRTLADFRGVQIRTPHSVVSWDLMKALGATPIDSNGPEVAAEIESGQLHGAETSFNLASSLPSPGTFTGNITFYGKVNTLIVGASALDRLTSGQQKLLRQAAAATLAQIISTGSSDADQARGVCAGGVAIVRASDADVQAIERAALPVRTRLERDPEIKDLVAGVERIVARSTGTDEVPACAPRTSTTQPPAPGTALPPDGVYRWQVTTQEMIDAGVNEADALADNGIFTMTIKKSRFSLHEQGTNEVANADDCTGTVSLSGPRTVFTGDLVPGCGTAAGSTLFSGIWAPVGSGLRFSQVGEDPFSRVVWGGKVWLKIG